MTMTTSLYKTPAGEQAVMAIYAAALENWRAPYETRTLPTRHGDTYAIISGAVAASALILLHGAGSNSAIWAGDVADYCQRYRVYAVDLIGEAGRSAPNRPAWEGAAFAEWLSDVLDGLEVERATFVGISQGAWAALKFATAHSERVAKLALLTPGGIVPDKRSFMFRAIAYMLLGQWGIRRMTRELFGDQPVPEGVEDIMVQVTAAFKPRMGVLPIFSDDELRRLTMPIYLTGGTKDTLRDLPKIAARMGDLVPDLTTKLIDGAGHALMNTSGCIMEFLTA